jgi:predicted flap endonuclease-1-like 5' DNA nuclease
MEGVLTYIVPESGGLSKTINPFAPLAASNPFDLLSSNGPSFDLLEQAKAIQIDMIETAFHFWLIPFRWMTPSEPVQYHAEPAAPAPTELPSLSLKSAPDAAVPVEPKARTPRLVVKPAVVTPAPVAAVVREEAVIPAKPPAPKAVSTPKPAPKPEAAPDDLERIIGIGPKLKIRLNELGILRFQQIAAWTPEEIAAINAKLGFPGRIEREGWQKQASRLTKETGKPAAKTGSKAA